MLQNVKFQKEKMASKLPKDKFNKIFTFLLDAIVPKRCINCAKFDTWLCDACHTTLPVLTHQQCPICKKVTTPLGQICLKCNKNIYIDSVFVVSSFDSVLLRDLIHNFKYKFIKELSDPLGLLIAQSLMNSHLPSPDLIMPVPLHKRRLRWRGFNQSELLARSIGLTIPIDNTSLIRNKYTTSQVKVKSRKKRISNIKNAFCVTQPAKIKEKSILLIDDVITTGSTLEECAKVLKKAGAKKVNALVLVRE